jgi:RNA polymerase sigma factor (sigma-70 family)
MDIVRERVIKHIKLAQILASKYFNIQGASREEVLSEAQTALVKASMAYQEEKGPFAPFAGAAIRNALNSLFNKQLRNAKMVAKSLDETIHGGTQFGTYIGNLGQNLVDTKRDVLREVGEKERSKELLRALKTLSNREKEIIDCISKGMSLSEVAKLRNVSKQAIFKIVKKAYQTLRKEIKYVKD